jgi:hypothetical protein
MAWLRHRFGNQQIATAPTDLDQQVRARCHHTHHHTLSDNRLAHKKAARMQLCMLLC